MLKCHMYICGEPHPRTCEIARNVNKTCGCSTCTYVDAPHVHMLMCHMHICGWTTCTYVDVPNVHMLMLDKLNELICVQIHIVHPNILT
jgi:hypothetical protein